MIRTQFQREMGRVKRASRGGGPQAPGSAQVPGRLPALTCAAQAGVHNGHDDAARLVGLAAAGL